MGEVLVKSLQNTKYSIDEKLENSFIRYFDRQPSKNHINVKDTSEAVDSTHLIEPSEQYQSAKDDADGSDEDTDGEDLEESSEHDNDALEASDEENGDAILQQFPQEHAEFHDGRVRRKAIFDDDANKNNVKVITRF